MKKKNKYFEETAQKGHILFTLSLYLAAELYYEESLKIIRSYEVSSGKTLNKGMVYANLGIAQMANGKFDIGIAHLLTAEKEDQPVNPNYDILNTRLWKQFEKPKIFDYLISLNKHPDAGLGFKIDEPFLTNLVTGMEQQDRIFFEGTIWVLLDNLQQHQVLQNVYTSGRLFSGLKDLCLLIEALLRKKQIVDGVITATHKITLGGKKGQPGLLSNALRKQQISYPQIGLNTSSNDINKFLENLENIFDTAASAELRRVYCLHLVRNFTGHHFSLSNIATSPKGKTFFEMYDSSLINVLSTILYFKHINEI